MLEKRELNPAGGEASDSAPIRALTEKDSPEKEAIKAVANVAIPIGDITLAELNGLLKQDGIELPSRIRNARDHSAGSITASTPNFGIVNTVPKRGQCSQSSFGRVEICSLVRDRNVHSSVAHSQVFG